MVAAGNYIKTLREGRKLTQDAVIERAAARLGHRIDPTTLWRIETGKRKTRSDILSAVVEAVQGNPDDVARLMNDPGATPDDGAGAAATWLSREQNARIDHIIESTPPDELAAVIEELRAEYLHNPGLLTFLRGALAGWRARGGDRPH